MQNLVGGNGNSTGDKRASFQVSHHSLSTCCFVSSTFARCQGYCLQGVYVLGSIGNSLHKYACLAINYTSVKKGTLCTNTKEKIVPPQLIYQVTRVAPFFLLLSSRSKKENFAEFHSWVLNVQQNFISTVSIIVE